MLICQFLWRLQVNRSEINLYINEAITLFAQCGFHLPPFAFWTPDYWRTVGPEGNEIRDNGLGWDVTDYGLGRFEAIGLLLFTLRNGNIGQKERYPKGYAEKVMVVKEGQVTPYHYHWNKREDIINRGGGELTLELYLAGENNGLSENGFTVSVDGVSRSGVPGEKITLLPRSLTPGCGV